jgi:hypothetical protein
MSLKEAITKSHELRDLWGMDVHVMNEQVEEVKQFNENYICVIDINLYIYTHHLINSKVYYTAFHHNL